MLGLKENVKWRNNISGKNDTEIEKVVQLQVKDLIFVIVKFRAEKMSCTFLMHQTREIRKILCTRAIGSNTLKRKEFKVFISLNETRQACFANS